MATTHKGIFCIHCYWIGDVEGINYTSKKTNRGTIISACCPQCGRKSLRAKSIDAMNRELKELRRIARLRRDK